MVYGFHSRVAHPITTANRATRIAAPRQVAGTTAKSAKTKSASSKPCVRCNPAMAHHSGNSPSDATWAGRAVAFPAAILWALAVVVVFFGTAAFTGEILHGLTASGSIVLISGAAVSMLRRIG